MQAVSRLNWFDCVFSVASHFRAASLIVSKAADLANIRKDDGFAALHLAALNGHYNVARALVEEVKGI